MSRIIEKPFPILTYRFSTMSADFGQAVTLSVIEVSRQGDRVTITTPDGPTRFLPSTAQQIRDALTDLLDNYETLTA